MTSAMERPHGRRRRGTEARELSFWIVAVIIVLSPMPFGGARPIWSSLLTVLVAIALFAYVWQRVRLGRRIPALAWPLVGAGVLVGGVAVWGLIQAMSGVPLAWGHPVWAVAREALGASIGPGAISVAPETSVQTALHYFTYLALGALVAFHARRDRNADLLLWLFILAQGAYAVYGLIVYVSDLEMVLWFEKEFYRGSLTSTFINRNSYATYVGLGALASLSVMLRYVRRITQSDRSTRGKVLAFAGTMWGGVVIPVLILSTATVALLLTGSRMGLAAFSLAALVFLGVWVGRLDGLQRWIGGTLLVGVVTVMGANFVLSGDTTMARFNALFEHGDGRFSVYPLVIHAIEDRPWLGHGLGTFETAFRPYRDETVGAFFNRAHSDYLETAMDVGLVGAGAVCLAFLSLAVAGLSNALQRTDFERPLLACSAVVLVGTHATVDFSLQIPAVVVAFLVCIGVGLGRRSNPSTLRENSVKGGAQPPGEPSLWTDRPQVS